MGLILSTKQMTKKIFFSIIHILIFSIYFIKAQTIDDVCKINLPVVIINTENNEMPTCEYIEHPAGAVGVGIINATKVPCSITIRMHDKNLYESGEYKADTSGATIKIRGNTSAQGAQKPYKLKLEKKADLLLRNNDEKYKDKDFLLLSTLNNCLKTYIGFTLNELMDMPYKPGAMPVNVFINNEYKGLYYLVESVKRNKKCRIDVDKETGYIFEYDAYWWNEDYSIPLDFDISAMRFTLKYPDSKEATYEQKDYIEQWLKDMQIAVLDGKGEEYLDLDTCARWIIAHDLLGTADGAGCNLFFAKADNTAVSKAYTPTLWDFDSICKENEEWSSPHTGGYFFFYQLFHHDKKQTFATAYCKTWINMTNSAVTKKLVNTIKKYASSEEGKEFEKSYNMTVTKYRKKTSNWKILDDANYYENWFAERELWLEEAINIQYPKIVTNLKQKHNNTKHYKTYDPLGRRTHTSYEGIKIKNGEKFLERH